jgi:RimJ/RimL family protein N-acetyltransferase
VISAASSSRYELNQFAQPVGLPVTEWTPPPLPARAPIEGCFGCLEPLDIHRHAAELHQANSTDTTGCLWTYLAYGPFACLDDYILWLSTTANTDDPLFFAIVDKTSGQAAGVASFLRINPASGSIEVGHVVYSSALKRTPLATEAMYLMMRQAFSLGYRRYEWKCDALNAPSRSAAQRLGFSFEGIFRQAAVYKGRNRDTAWYAVIDQEWPALQQAFVKWLDPNNFDDTGRQRTRLADLTSPLLHQRG